MFVSPIKMHYKQLIDMPIYPSKENEQNRSGNYNKKGKKANSIFLDPNEIEIKRILADSYEAQRRQDPSYEYGDNFKLSSEDSNKDE